jgi:hypothetical protein
VGNRRDERLAWLQPGEKNSLGFRDARRPKRWLRRNALARRSADNAVLWLRQPSLQRAAAARLRHNAPLSSARGNIDRTPRLKLPAVAREKRSHLGFRLLAISRSAVPGCLPSPVAFVAGHPASPRPFVAAIARRPLARERRSRRLCSCPPAMPDRAPTARRWPLCDPAAASPS